MACRRPSRRLVSAALAVLLATLLGSAPSGAVGMPVTPGTTLAHPCVEALDGLGRECQVALLATLGSRGVQAFSLGTPGVERPAGDRATLDVALDARPNLSLRPPVTGAQPGPLSGPSEIHREPATGRAARPPPIAP